MKPARSFHAALWACVGANAIVSALALAGSEASSITLAIACAFLPYAWLVAESEDVGPDRAVQLARVGAAIAGACLLLAPPVLSDDVYRYLWDGRVLLHGIDPYRYAPDHPALFGLRDALWEQINHREIATIYPPVAQLLFALCELCVHAPLSPKLLALVAHLACIGVVARLAGERRGQAALMFGLNPLALEESAMHGHIDAVAGCAVAYGVWRLIAGEPVRAALALAMATGTKLIGVLLLPFMARARLSALLLGLSLSMLVVAPLLLHAGESQSGLSQYARRWRGNSALFPVIERQVERSLEAIAEPADRARGHVRLARLKPVLDKLADTPLDPWKGATAERKNIPDRSDFELGFLAGLLTRAVVMALTFLAPCLLLAFGVPTLAAARATLLFALLAAPQVHPWYLLWLLPLEAAYGRNAGFAWSATVLFAYAPLDLWQRARIWNEWSLANLCEFGVLGLVLLCDAWVFKEGRTRYARLSPLSNRTRAE